jgi:hypothetical protein
LIIEAVGALRSDLVLVGETATIRIVEARDPCGARHTGVTNTSGGQGGGDQEEANAPPNGRAESAWSHLVGVPRRAMQRESEKSRCNGEGRHQSDNHAKVHLAISPKRHTDVLIFDPQFERR